MKLSAVHSVAEFRALARRRLPRFADYRNDLMDQIRRSEPWQWGYRVKTEAEAIALANDSDFGLGGSVWTRDVARGRRVASQIDTGMMFVNNIDWTDAELPFGGIKNSGYGRELGNMGIQEFVNKKLVRTAQLDAPV